MRTMAVFTVFLALSSSARAVDFTAIVAGAAQQATFGQVIDQLQTAGEALVDKAQNSASAVAFVAGAQVLAALNAFEGTAGRLLDKSMKDLGRKQYDFVNSVAITLQKAQDGADQALFQAEGLMNLAGTLSQGVPFVKERAVVSSYFPLVLPPTDARPVRLQFQGFGFGFGTPRLTLGGKTLESEPSASTQLTFLVPPELLGFTELEAKYLNAQLSLTEPAEESLAARIARTFTGKPRATRQRTFDLKLLVMPKKLGSYTLRSTFGQEVTQVENRSAPVAYNKKGGRGCRTDNFEVRSSDRTIVGEPTFINVSRKKGDARIIFMPQSGRFQVEACAEGHGPFDRYDGYSHQDVTWVETWKTRTSTIQEVGGTLDWATQVPLELPPTTEKWLLTVKTFENKTYVLDNVGDADYLNIGYNPNGKVVFLRPLSFWALR